MQEETEAGGAWIEKDTGRHIDEENARGHFYHVCRGVLQKDEVLPPPPGEPISCTVCGVELEYEDFVDAQMKGGT